ncbi:MAG TPA: methyltransferase domain-containing protein [Leptospiraceae bacterium]|nr:methyltransferase domain-containing protein [Leptospiraceae bacterium]HNN07036.1 methyltransferase domain-containing protein [Leptospiraceae bacterium]
MSNIDYIGSELEIFQYAVNWKEYWSSSIVKFIKGDVLEVGAGIGTNTIIFKNTHFCSWTSVEPDRKLVEKLKQNLNDSSYNVVHGTIKDTPGDSFYDTILYIDVIEHIEKDREELLNAYEKLKVGGHLIILVPAHNFLYSEFDKSIGHFRRYSRKELLYVIPAELNLLNIRYLDSLGVMASTVNKVFLKQPSPNKSQILFWDRVIIPISRIMDRILFYKMGKSLVGIWKK